MTASQAKQAIRERVWAQLEQASAAEPGVRGYIPAFDGVGQAARRLAGLPAWQQAQVLEVAPDRAQLPVRIRALHDGKLVYMAAPSSPRPSRSTCSTRMPCPCRPPRRQTGR